MIWKKVLNEIYSVAPHSICEGDKFPRNSNNHPTAKKLKMEGEELFKAIGFLEEQELIKIVRGNGKEFWQYWQLTEKGFNVALENQKHETEMNLLSWQKWANWLIAILTLVLAVEAGFNIWAILH